MARVCLVGGAGGRGLPAVSGVSPRLSAKDWPESPEVSVNTSPERGRLAVNRTGRMS